MRLSSVSKWPQVSEAPAPFTYWCPRRNTPLTVSCLEQNLCRRRVFGLQRPLCPHEYTLYLRLRVGLSAHRGLAAWGCEDRIIRGFEHDLFWYKRGWSSG
jgi:hypothetical protein